MHGRRAIWLAATIAMTLAAVVAAVIWNQSASRSSAGDDPLPAPPEGFTASSPSPTIKDDEAASRRIVAEPFVEQASPRPGHRLVSVVARFDDGTPIANSQVQLEVNDYRSTDLSSDAYLAWDPALVSKSLRLDSQGRCAFETPLGVALDLSLEGAGPNFGGNRYAYEHVVRIGPAQTDAEIVLNVNLLRVTVVDGAGYPIVARRFSAYSAGESARAHCTVKTDARGVIEFRGYPSGPVGLYDVDRTEVFEGMKRGRIQFLPDVMQRQGDARESDYTIVAAQAGSVQLDFTPSDVDVTAPSDVLLTMQPISLATVRVLDAARRPIADVKVAISVQVDGYEFEFPLAKGVTDRDGTAWNALPCDGRRFGRSAKLSYVKWTIWPPDGADPVVVMCRPGAIGELVNCGDVVLATGRRWRFVVVDDDPPMCKMRSGRQDKPEFGWDLEWRTPDDDGTVVVYPRPGDDVAIVNRSDDRVVPILPEALKDDGPGQRVSIDELPAMRDPIDDERYTPPPDKFPLTIRIVEHDGRPAKHVNVRVRGLGKLGINESITYGSNAVTISIPPDALEIVVSDFDDFASTHMFEHSARSLDCTIRLPETRLLRVMIVPPRDATNWEEHSPSISASIPGAKTQPQRQYLLEREEHEGSAGETASNVDPVSAGCCIFRSESSATIVVEAEYAGRRYRVVAPPDVDSVTIPLAEGAVAVAFAIPPFPFAVYHVLKIIDERGHAFLMGGYDRSVVGEPWSISSIPLYPGRFRASLEARVFGAIGEPSLLRETAFLVEPGRPMTVTLPR